MMSNLARSPARATGPGQSAPHRAGAQGVLGAQAPRGAKGAQALQGAGGQPVRTGADRAARGAGAAGKRPAAVQLQAAAKWLAFGLALLPLGNLLWQAFDPVAGLGANPVERLTRVTGYWSLVMLCICLAVTPLRRLAGWQFLIRWRRMLGLYAFFYGSLHVLVYLWLEQFFALGEILRDILQRPFITVGAVCFLLMVPLALTSTQGMIRRLGRNWLRLHQLVYPMLVLAVLHFWWMRNGKNDLAEPMIFALLASFLLGVRLYFYWRKQAKAARGA